MRSLRLALLGAPLVAALSSCVAEDNLRKAPPQVSELSQSPLSNVAEQFVQLTLRLGEKEAGYVDAYYGRPEWQESAKASKSNMTDLGNQIIKLMEDVDAIDPQYLVTMERRRRAFLQAQLEAAKTRHFMMLGEKFPFAKEATGLFGVAPKLKPLAEFDAVLKSIAKLVPGDGPLNERVDAYQNRFTIPKDKLKPVFDAAIAECRARTAKHIDLPEGESFTMEFVTDKPWSGYNYYQGGYNSLIQINTDLPIRISRAVDLGCHEGYPGHHALNMLLEQKLTKGKGWEEFSIYPLYSPQSLIAEGSANYGIDLAFPGKERLKFETEVLYPLAGLDPAGAKDYLNLLGALGELSGARFTIAQMYLDGQVDRAEAERLTQKYQLVSAARAKQTIKFTDTYRSYVINYGLGKDMVRDHVEAAGNDPIWRWKAMEKIISEPTLPRDLLKH